MVNEDTGLPGFGSNEPIFACSAYFRGVQGGSEDFREVQRISADYPHVIDANFLFRGFQKVFESKIL